MSRSTTVISVSIPEALARDLERMAREEGVSKSELVRRMAGAYKREQAGLRLLELQRRLAPRARAAGILTEADVDRVVFDDR